MLTIGPIISRASSGMVSSWARAMLAATGLTRRFHIGMVCSSQSWAFQALACAWLAGSAVAPSSQSSARRKDSSAARESASLTGFTPAMR